MSNVAPGLEPTASKALTSFLSRPRVPTAFTEEAYPGVPSTDLEPLKLWAQQLPAPSPEVVHITVSDVTLLGKSWMHRCNQMLRPVHPAIRAVRFRFPMAAVQVLCRQSSGKLIGTPQEFGTRVMGTKDLQHGWTANLGVSHVAPKKGLLEALPFGVGVVSEEWWESLSACPIIPEWCHVVPDYTTPALYRTKESVFLRGAASPPPYISLAARCSHMNSRPMTLSRMGPCVTWGSGWLGGRYRPRSARTGTAFSSTPAAPSRMQFGISCPMHTLARSAWQIPNCHGAGVLGPASLSLCWEGTPCNGLVSSAVLASPR